ncbi:cysteine dioxygenase [Paenibacillus roseipurpureus]|uniref:Cysteine dioxygenase family protein n=1 Tax=Paenibacillus roseopurpureus TaxID=2918901 RepID=A0AA96LJT4_9BACL|nr:cysteine dioxygenase family protein [Paenibacillus sp. MBLB1832]WNR42387.1 cysteine dioxygenase family protein [Paenibacillus sp. MBLB1832]
MSLIRAIEQTFCKLQSPTTQQLVEALQSIERNLTYVPDLKTEPSQHAYGRNVVYSTPHLEVIIIHIPPSRSTAIHNHGSSIGAACLVTGTLVNSIYTLDETGYPVASRDHFIQACDYFIAPKEQIHQLSNPFHEPAISIHVYSPPLREVKRYLPYSEVLDYVI